MGNLKDKFYLISFLPALAYWYLETNYPIRVAVLGGLILAILELALEKIFTKHLHALSKLNFWLILFLGSLSLGSDQGIWFKLQPAFTGLVIGIFLFYRLKKGNGLFIEMIKSMQKKLPPPEIILNVLEKHVAIFFLLYGLFMGVVALKLDTSWWLFFKTLGFYLIAGVFMVLEMVYLRFFYRL